MREQLVQDTDHVMLARLVTELFWRIDHGKADSVHEMFTADGQMSMGPTALRGREELQEWGRKRVHVSYRTLHLCTNMRFVTNGDDAATGHVALTVYQDDSEGPGTTLPAAVGEDQDRFVRTSEGWQFECRSFNVAFARQSPRPT